MLCILCTRIHLYACPKMLIVRDISKVLKILFSVPPISGIAIRLKRLGVVHVCLFWCSKCSISNLNWCFFLALLTLCDPGCYQKPLPAFWQFLKEESMFFPIMMHQKSLEMHFTKQKRLWVMNMRLFSHFGMFKILSAWWVFTCELNSLDFVSANVPWSTLCLQAVGNIKVTRW